MFEFPNWLEVNRSPFPEVTILRCERCGGTWKRVTRIGEARKRGKIVIVNKARNEKRLQLTNSAVDESS